MSDRGTWKIVIGGSTFADYADVVTPVDSGGMPLIQQDKIMGAAFSKNRQKANFELVQTFEFLIEQDSNADAADLWMRGPTIWNGVKDVDVYHVDYAGAEAHWTLMGTTVDMKPKPHTGPTNTGTITFTGGVIALAGGE